jgi:hypothetical protein
VIEAECGGNFRAKPENYPHIFYPPQRFQKTLINPIWIGCNSCYSHPERLNGNENPDVLGYSPAVQASEGSTLWLIKRSFIKRDVKFFQMRIFRWGKVRINGNKII